MIVLYEGFLGKGKSHEAVQKIAEELFKEPPSSSSTTTEDIAQQPTKNQNKIQE
jgi:endonuclease IV